MKDDGCGAFIMRTAINEKKGQTLFLILRIRDGATLAGRPPSTLRRNRRLLGGRKVADDTINASKLTFGRLLFRVGQGAR